MHPRENHFTGVSEKLRIGRFALAAMVSQVGGPNFFRLDQGSTHRLRNVDASLKKQVDQVLEVVRNLLCATDKGHSETALANAHVFLEMTGHVVVAWLWLEQALISLRKLADTDAADRDFYQGKLQACRYFFRWELPKTGHWYQLLNELDPTCLEMQDGWF